MSNLLAQMIAERISSGLARKSVTTCSRWAERYRIMGSPFPGPWTFRHHPWLRGMMDSESETNVGQKAAQVGFSEAVLNRVFFTLDVKRADCLYVLPSQNPGATDFSSGRFAPALELSPHLHSLFSDANNVGHKRAGSANLYIRGSHSRDNLKSVPVGFLVLDELDEMTQENVPMAFSRMQGQDQKLAWLISTPTLDNFGINSWFDRSSKNHFFFPCPSCERLIELTWPESIVITADHLDDPRIQDTHLICTLCKSRLPDSTKTDWLGKGVWVESIPGRDIKGWYINQLYSCANASRPSEIAKSFLISTTDKAAEVEFHNQALGVPHAVEGAKLSDEDINNCIAGYKRGEVGHQGLVTMGVDVGSWLHYEIDAWNIQGSSGADINIFSQCRCLTFGKVKNFEDLDELIRNWGVDYTVIDAQPERRKALETANRWYGRVKVCFYGNGVNGRTLGVSDVEQSVTVDRTTWLDMSLGRIRRGKPWMALPSDVDAEYRGHLKALVRDYRNDQWGNPIGRYVKAEKDPDHYAHARNYAEIALPLAAGLGTSTDLIKQVV